MYQSICTIPVCTYLIIAQSFFRRIYNPYTAGAYHVSMLLFWTIDLGLAVHLAKLWSGYGCAYKFFHGYICVPYEKRIVGEARTISYKGYQKMLVVDAILAAFEL
jgi:hypothetical protein